MMRKKPHRYWIIPSTAYRIAAESQMLHSEVKPEQKKPHTLAASIQSTFAHCLEIIRKKNHDYASEENEYRNFEAGLRIGVSVQKSIMLRLQDKMARLENLMTKEAYVTEESFEDTLTDAICYLAILKARREYEKIPRTPYRSA